MLKQVFPRRLPLFAALLVLTPGLWLIARATYAASYSPFGRDQGIFQYFAWAIRQGDLLYRDIRDVNGPLTTAVHFVFQLLGGEDEHRFRILDLLVTGSVFCLLGASLPGIGRSQTENDKPPRFERFVWGLAAWVLGSASYLSNTYWHITQRETFACWFLFGSVAAQLWATSPQYFSTNKRPAFVWTVLAGALAITTWFGKPPFVFFLPGQLLALLWDDEAVLSRRQRFAAFFAGAVLGGLLNLGFVAVYGDLRAFIKIVVFDVPVFYRFIWARTIAELFAESYVRWETGFALLGSALIISLVLWRKMPRRVLMIALFPLGALANVIAQRKGFQYHYQPLELCSRFIWLTLLVWLGERFSRESILRAMPAMILGLAMGLGAAWQGQNSPHTAAFPVIWERVRTAPERETEEYFAIWSEWYFYPWEMRQGAKYVQEHTRPDERIAVYGLDPYFWFLARRLSTTPYVYAYDLNVGAALQGGPGAVPDAAAREKIIRMWHEHVADFSEKLKNRPPAAFVYIEHAPLTSYWDDGPRDFAAWCPEPAAWVNARYQEAIRFGVVRVFLPKTIDESASPAEDEPPKLP